MIDYSYNLAKKILSKKTNQQFILYFMIGSVAALIDFTLVFVFTSILGIYYLLSVVLSYPVAVSVHFTLNKKFNFKDTSKKVVKQFILFVSITLSSVVLTLIIMYFLVEFLGIWYLIAKAIAMVIVVFYTFNMNRVFTFNRF